MNAFKREWFGRIGRLHYFLGSLLGLVPLFVLVSLWGVLQMLTTAAIIDPLSWRFFNGLTPLLITDSIVVFFLLHLYLAIRRCHDFGYTGWVAVLTFVPYLNVVVAALLLFIPGNSDDNTYGPFTASNLPFLADVFNF